MDAEEHQVTSETPAKERVVIARLAEHSEWLPMLARWLEREWPDWYGPHGPGEATADLEEAAQSDGLPLAVIALLDGVPCGISVLRPTDAAAAQTGHAPWVGGGLVRADLRGQGIGARLLAAMESEARRLGFGTIYCSTTGAERLLERCGWQSIGTITHDGAPLAVYRKPVSIEDGA
jgi:GNAT superfamily N-acetyltransferase